MAGMVVVEQGELLWPTNGFFVHYVRAKHVYKFAMIYVDTAALGRGRRETGEVSTKYDRRKNSNR